MLKVALCLSCFQNSYVNLRRRIPTLNEGTIKRWVAGVGTKQWQNTKRYTSQVDLFVALHSVVFTVLLLIGKILTSENINLS